MGAKAMPDDAIVEAGLCRWIAAAGFREAATRRASSAFVLYNASSSSSSTRWSTMLPSITTLRVRILRSRCASCFYELNISCRPVFGSWRSALM